MVKSVFLVLFCCESSAEARRRETFLILFALDSFSDGQKVCQRNDSFRPGAESMVFAWCLQVLHPVPSW